MGKKSYSDKEQQKGISKEQKLLHADDSGCVGSVWIRSLSRKDLSLLLASFDVVANYSLGSDLLFRQVHKELDQLVHGPRTAIPRSSKAGALENRQRDLPFLHMVRNVNHQREIDAFIVVAATCHRYSNNGRSPAAFINTPKDPEGHLRKSVTTGRGTRAISVKGIPHVIAVIRSAISFDDLFSHMDQYRGTGKLDRSKSSAEVFFTRLGHFADGLSNGPAVSREELRREPTLEASADTRKLQGSCNGESANAPSHQGDQKTKPNRSKSKKFKNKRKNSLWLNRLLVATTSWNSSVRSRAERRLLGRYFRGKAELLGGMQSWGDEDPTPILIDLVLLLAIVLAKHPGIAARTSIKALGIDLDSLTLRKKVRYPQNRFKPTDGKSQEYVTIFENLELSIPPVLSQMLKQLYRLGLISPNFRLKDHLKVSGMKTGKAIVSRVRELADELGMPRIGLDQFAQQLVLYMNDDVGDDMNISKEASHWQVFCILGAKHHLPPIGSHYEAVSDEELSQIYARSTENYFEGKN